MKNFTKTYSVLSALVFSTCIWTPAHALTSNYTNDYQTSVESEYQEEEAYSQGQLAQLLAPIALYPDSLLVHVLAASTYPLDVVKAHRLNEQNNHLSLQQKIDHGHDMGWDPSLIALLGFPDLLAQMNSDLEWTVALGDAFNQQEASVLEVVQVLRNDAYAVNQLNNLKHLNVRYVNHQVLIEPKHHTQIYLPIYNSHTVYGNWRWKHYQPTYFSGFKHAHSRSAIGISWGRSVSLNFDFFFGGMHWNNKHVVFSHHRNTRNYRAQHKIISHKSAKRFAHYKHQNAKKRYLSKKRSSARHGKAIHNAKFGKRHTLPIQKKRIVNAKHSPKKKTVFNKKVSKQRVDIAKQTSKKRVVHNKQVSKKRVAIVKQAPKKRVVHNKQVSKKRLAIAKQAPKKRVVQNKQISKQRLAIAKQAPKKRVVSSKQQKQQVKHVAKRKTERQVSKR